MATDKQILVKAVNLSREHAPKAKYAAYVDFSRRADEHRFFLVDVDANKIIYSWYTSHGSGSGTHEKATKFSNVNMSRMSSKGLLKTGEIYVGKYGRSLKLHGLEPGINDNVEARAIVIHQSRYVSVQYMTTHQWPGRSWGCITLEPAKKEEIIGKLKGGSIVFIGTE